MKMNRNSRQEKCIKTKMFHVVSRARSRNRSLVACRGVEFLKKWHLLVTKTPQSFIYIVQKPENPCCLLANSYLSHAFLRSELRLGKRRKENKTENNARLDKYNRLRKASSKEHNSLSPSL